jgi:hypothetical protein
VNRNRRKQARYCFIADQQRNHRQHDGTREAREVSQFACAENESRISRMLAGVGTGVRCR